MYKLLKDFFIMFLPSAAKIFILNKMGHKIHKSAYISFSFLNVSHIALGENTYIGSGNIFKGLSRLNMEEGSRINRWNYFTSNPALKSHLRVGKRSSVSMRHYFDLSGDINIESDTIIAGVRSTFLTHSKGIDQIDYIKPITIGNWCYIGSNSSFVPGARIGDNCFVGMGSVVTKDCSKITFSLLAGAPAIVKKKISAECSYYLQEELVHSHTIINR